MYSTVAMHVKGASCVNKISNYLAQWTNQNTNRSWSIDRYPAEPNDVMLVLWNIKLFFLSEWY